MTKKEALQSLLTFPVKETLVEKVLIDHGIIGTENYTKDSEKEIDLAFAGMLFFIINTPDESEGDWSVKIDRASLKRTRNAILNKYDLSDGDINCESIW